jgi:polyisoprenoid-binding protein YceI
MRCRDTERKDEQTMKLRRVAAIAIGALALAAGAFAQPARWEIDPVHSNASFTVRHLMVSNVRGEFTKLAGALDVAGNDPTTAKVSVTIEAASVNTREPKRDDHLRSADFFDVAKFPTLTFVSKKIEGAGEGRLKMTGDLTIHGVTREVTFDVDSLTPPMKDPWGGTRAGAHATATINRKDFGLVWNKALEAGGVMVGDDVKITLDVELVKKA